MKDYSYKEYSIPKKNGKLRKIVAPSEDLLTYQRQILTDIEKFYTNLTYGTRLEEIINGFVPGKNCVTAAEQHIGFKSTVVMDLSNFFDTVKKDMFNDPHSARHYPEITLKDKLFHREGYCAQGFATSPLLANIAFIPAILEIDDYLSCIGAGYAFTIYADDIQISTHLDDSKFIKEYIIDEITEIIEAHKFEINSNKTRIRYAKYGYRKILGINVGDTEIRGTRKTMKKIRAALHQQNGPSLGGLRTWSLCYPPNPKTESKKK